jgi:oxygen-independent coproporphyrinogen-3 oxidase
VETAVERAGSREAEGEGGYDDGAVGVYLHLPYCERICPYCDFAVVAAGRLDPSQEARYVAALLAELALRSPDFAGRSLETLYLGGGTPSLFSPESIRRLVDGVVAAFGGRQALAEVTLELNPSTVERERLPGFREAGIDRLSIGVQSFDDGMLKRLGRAHRAEESFATLEAARRAGFGNLSVDLIFAGPGQTSADLDRDLALLASLDPEHVSTYERLGAAGYERYEISSYARPGFRGRHNARYWHRQAVLGLGMGAHSTEGRSRLRPHGARRANPRSLEVWLHAVEHGRVPGVLEPISPATARGEAIFLGLRQREGVSARRFAAEFGAPPRAFFGSEIEVLVRRGWLREGQGGEASAEAGEIGDLRLSAAGRLVADSVAAEFVEGDGSD